MTRAEMQALPGAKDGLVRKYIDKSGRKGHAGIPSLLKGSQPLGYEAEFILSSFVVPSCVLFARFVKCCQPFVLMVCGFCC